MSDGSPEAKTAAANALLNLACDADNQVLIVKVGGIEPLVLLLSDGSPVSRAAAANALFKLAGNAEASDYEASDAIDLAITSMQLPARAPLILPWTGLGTDAEPGPGTRRPEHDYRRPATGGFICL